jgi:hypothetical protein
MALLSRSFIRKRLISLATTLSVSATSFALAQDPTTAHHIRATAADFNEQQFLFDNNLAMSNVNGGHACQADERDRSRFRHDDDPSPSGYDRDRASRAQTWS